MKEKINQIAKTSIVDFKIDNNYFEYFIRTINENIHDLDFKIFFNSYLKNNKLKKLNRFVKDLTKSFVKERCKNKKIEEFLFEFLSRIDKDKLTKFITYNMRVSISDFYCLNRMFLLINKIINDKLEALKILEVMVYVQENLVKVAKYNNIEINQTFFEKITFGAESLYNKDYFELYIKNYTNNNSLHDLPDLFYYPGTKIYFLKKGFEIWEKYYSRQEFLEYLLQYYSGLEQYKRRILFIFKELGIKPKEVFLIPKHKRCAAVEQFIEDLSKTDDDFAGYSYFD